MLCSCDEGKRFADMGEDATEEKEEESDCKLGIDELYSSILFSRLYIFRLINKIGL